MSVRVVAFALLAGLSCSVAMAQAPAPAKRFTPSDADLANLASKMDQLETLLNEAKAKFLGDDAVRGPDALADAAVFLHAGRRIVRLGEFFQEDSAARTVEALKLGESRARDLAEGKHPWASARGGVARGYVSKVDGSIQPYAVYVPEAYDGSKKVRLDVVLHGRDASLTEVKFLLAHQGKPMPEGESGLVLHVFGRGNNAYRWVGETDVFEAIEAVKRNYLVDDLRVVLRGFSMGGAGAWHLGLHHPSDWCAVEAGAGFSETKAYAKLKELPDYQEKALHIYDAVDYARNAWIVPIAGYGGEDDPQKKASENIEEALKALGVTMKTEGLVTKAEGIDFLRVVGAKTGHRVDPESAKVLKAFRDDHAAKGLDLFPKHVRFVTYTLKYNDAEWLSAQGLFEHYKPATIEATIEGDVATVTAENVAVLGVERQAAETIKLDGQVLPLRTAVRGLLPNVYFRKIEAGWETLDYDQSRAFQENTAGGKRHNLQGPIDDAFTSAFLVVRPTGTPWNPNVGEWSKARIDRFVAEWAEFARAELPIKDDSQVSPEDIETKHLILFGDPGSNAVMARVIGSLPLSWTKTELSLGGKFPSADHVPALIAPNPLNRLKYVVLNSGPTFGAKEFQGTNALLFPRLGDWAALRIGSRTESAETSGFFDERWRMPPGTAPKIRD